MHLVCFRWVSTQKYFWGKMNHMRPNGVFLHTIAEILESMYSNEVSNSAAVTSNPKYQFNVLFLDDSTGSFCLQCVGHNEPGWGNL